MRRPIADSEHVQRPQAGTAGAGKHEGRRGSYIDLARRAADGIRQALKPGAAPVSSPSGLTVNSEAELAFREGQYSSNRYNNQHRSQDFDLAVASLTRALELDPKSADSAAGVALLFVSKIEAGTPLQESLPQIERYGRRALEINPRCTKGWVALSYPQNGPQQGGTKDLEYALKAVSIGPEEPTAHIALGGALSSYELAAKANWEARRLDPLYIETSLNAAAALGRLGRPAEALPLVDEALRIDSDTPYALWLKSMLLADLGRTAEAANFVRRVQTWTRERRLPALLPALARHAVALRVGDSQASAKELRQLLKTVDNPGYQFPNVDFAAPHIVPFLSRRGDGEAALQRLERCLEKVYIPFYDWLTLDSRLDPLRSNPRFLKVLSRSRSRFAETLCSCPLG
jgi:tetratricopeptide (TPR) repeat protein